MATKKDGAIAAPATSPQSVRRGRPRLSERKENILSFRGSKAYKAWFDGLVEYAQQNRYVSDASFLFDLAIVGYAKSIGYKPEAPRR